MSTYLAEGLQEDYVYSSNPIRGRSFFYGWYIVGVGFLSHSACAFFLSSTLSVFLKPITTDLGVSRGVFSLLRSGEHLVIAAIAPLIGSLLDRHGPKWLMAIGALVSGSGFILLGQIGGFWQFSLIRLTLISIGGALMCHMVVNVTISRWFIRKRGRAIAIASLGQGIAKVSIPLVAASLFVWLGWRQTWAVFGLLILILVMGPAVLWMRRSPEDMGLHPDGALGPYTGRAHDKGPGASAAERQPVTADVVWSRRQVLRTRAFWLIVLTFSVTDIGIAGLNLHAFSYVTDIGYSTIVAATVMSIIAFSQLSSTLCWGFLSDRIDVRKAIMLKFLILATGLSLIIATHRILPIYAGFFLYGIGLGGGQVLQEVIWANYFGRLSLGAIRGLSYPIILIFASAGPPFFGFFFDLTNSYFTSFLLFIVVLLASAYLTRFIHPPRR